MPNIDKQQAVRQLQEDSHVERITNRYWQIASIWEGRSSEVLPVGEALRELGSMTLRLGPHRCVLSKIQALSDDIILNNVG